MAAPILGVTRSVDVTMKYLRQPLSIARHRQPLEQLVKRATRPSLLFVANAHSRPHAVTVA